MPISLTLGSIVDVATDAIVNAANSDLLPGGGVSGAIHANAGPELALACRQWVAEHGRVPAGCAAITPGFHLPARFVIHAVGPIWHGGDEGEAEVLASAYRSSMTLALENRCRTVAFPSISTGIYGFPEGLAAPVALAAVAESPSQSGGDAPDVIFVLFDEASYDEYAAALRE